nr:hypothetical protein [Pararhodobacter sp.]
MSDFPIGRQAFLTLTLSGKSTRGRQMMCQTVRPNPTGLLSVRIWRFRPLIRLPIARQHRLACVRGGIVAGKGDVFRGFHALAVDHTGSRLHVASCREARGRDRVAVDLGQQAILISVLFRNRTEPQPAEFT